MDSINFDTFDSPAGGVELSDTLSSWRKKTNGIITKVSSLDSGSTALETKVNTSNVNNNSIVLGKVQQVASNKLLGNVGSGNANVAEVEIDVTASGLQDSDDTIPTSKAVKDHVATHVNDTVYNNGMVVETYGGRCVGQTVSALSGNVVMPNITTSAQPTNTGEVIGAVRITRPTGIKYIIYDFDYQAGWDYTDINTTGDADEYGIWSTLAYVDKRSSGFKVEGNNFNAEQVIDLNNTRQNTSAESDVYNYPTGLLPINNSLNYYQLNATTINGQYRNRFVIECLDSAPSDVAASAAAGKIHWPVGDTNTIFTRFRNEHGESNVIGLFSGRYYRERDYDQTGVDDVANSASRKLASPSLIITTTA
jgi:hypothetical protein